MSSDCDTPACEPDRRVGIADEAGQPPVVDNDMSLRASSRPPCRIFRDDAGRLRFERLNRSPWNPWEGEL
jgi:hypothetical protein